MALLTVKEVEKRTGLHKVTIRRYIREGKIQAISSGDTTFDGYRIEESELAKLPKPYKKRNQQQEREVPQGSPFPFALHSTPPEQYREETRRMIVNSLGQAVDGLNKAVDTLTKLAVI